MSLLLFCIVTLYFKLLLLLFILFIEQCAVFLFCAGVCGLYRVCGRVCGCLILNRPTTENEILWFDILFFISTTISNNLMNQSNLLDSFRSSDVCHYLEWIAKLLNNFQRLKRRKKHMFPSQLPGYLLYFSVACFCTSSLYNIENT